MRAQPTSALALREAEVSGQLNGKRFEIARAFQLYGPGTSAEVLRKAGLDRNRNLMRARVTELADLGWLKQGAARKCAVTGRKAIVWTFERVEPRAKQPTTRELIDALRDAIAVAVTAGIFWPADPSMCRAWDNALEVSARCDR